MKIIKISINFNYGGGSNDKASDGKKMTTKELIVSTLRATGRENIEAVINYMETHGYFTAMCYSHHRYSGGLADHSWEVYQYAKRKNYNGDMSAESIAIAALLHDFCKCSGMYEFFGHGSRSASMVKKLGLHLTPDEDLAICFHMSLKGKQDEDMYDAASRCRLREIIHRGDIYSSSTDWYRQKLKKLQ